MLKCKHCLLICCIFSVLYNASGQAKAPTTDTLIQSIPLTFKNQKLSGKYTIEIDTTTSFDSKDYSRTDIYTQYEVAEEIINFIKTLKDSTQRMPLLNLYSIKIITTKIYEK